MPTILLKKSDTASAVPTTANLTNLAGGVEVAVNTADKRMFTMTSASAVVELGTNPSSLTLTGGTANGVLYLNASKAVTSGSALTFDGTNLGVGVTLSAWKSGARAIQSGANGYLSLWEQTNGSTNLGFGVYESASNTFAYRTTGDAPALYSQLSGQHIWSNAASGTANATFSFTELMRLTSTGLGIGTSSPNCKFEVKGGSAISTLGNSYTNAGLLHQYSSSILLAIGSDGTNPVFQGVNATNNTAKDITLQPLGGNLGLGVTPSAWGGAVGTGNLQLAASALYTFGTNGGGIATNAFYSSGNVWVYRNSTQAALYQQTAGQHQWHTAASGTAGNTITFSQAMTLDANGVLFAGAVDSVSSGVRALFTGTVGSVPVVKIDGVTANGFTLLGDHYGADESIVTLGLSYSSGATIIGNTVAPSTSNDTGFISTQDTYACRGAAIRLDGGGGAISFWNSNTNSTVTTGSARTLTQAMTLDASGNLGVGTTSPSGKIACSVASSGTFQNAYVASNGVDSDFLVRIKTNVTEIGNSGGVGVLAFAAGGGTERARITAGGQFIIGSTTGNGRLTVYGTGTSGSTYSFETTNSNGNTTFLVANDGTARFYKSDLAESARFTPTGNLLVGTTTDVSGRSGVISDVSGNVRAIPRTGAEKTSDYTLAITDVGQFVQVGTSGSVTVPNNTFATGDVVSVFNNTTGNISLNCPITTAYVGGTNTDRASVTLSTRGVATVLFINPSLCVINGNVS